MNKVEAYLKNVRISPRKVRLVANLLKGMTVSQAESELTFLPKRASSILIKLLRSAKANALQGGFGHESLKVIDVRVDEGRKIKRYRKQAPGRVKKIFKRSSHIHMVLESSGPAVKKHFVQPKSVEVVQPEAQIESAKKESSVQAPAATRKTESKTTLRKGRDFVKRVFRRKAI